jgi:hypothetical protein
MKGEALLKYDARERAQPRPTLRRAFYFIKYALDRRYRHELIKPALPGALAYAEKLR